ncbi:MAG: ATP-binding protein [Candidatus Muiribacteriota bacterium]
MKEIVVISGKGGTGKTTITSAFSYFLNNKVMADCDVDAPDLEIIFSPQIKQKFDFFGGKKATIIDKKCDFCGECYRVCAFKAISNYEGKYVVNSLDCEGCGACVYFCPREAISFKRNVCGEYYNSNTRLGPLIHAELIPGEENSGKLVVEVKKQAKKIAQEEKLDYILCDGTPGIGCAVIASISGADFSVCVTEPGVSAIHDMKRILELTRHFNIKTGVIINKADINHKKTEEIENFLLKNNIYLLGKINFNKEIVQSQILKQTIPEYNLESETSKQIENIFKKMMEEINE